MTIGFTTIEKIKEFKGKIKFLFDGNFAHIIDYTDENKSVCVGDIQSISNHRDSNKIEIFTDSGNICILK